MTVLVLLEPKQGDFAFVFRGRVQCAVLGQAMLATVEAATLASQPHCGIVVVELPGPWIVRPVVDQSDLSTRCKQGARAPPGRALDCRVARTKSGLL